MAQITRDYSPGGMIVWVLLSEISSLCNQDDGLPGAAAEDAQRDS